MTDHHRKQVRIYLEIDTLEQCQRTQSFSGMNLSDTVQHALNHFFQQEAKQSHERNQ